MLRLHLQIVGSSLLLLSIMHVVIAKRLNWKQDLSSLTPINRQIFYVHAFFICLVLSLIGALCLLEPSSLLSRTPLARLVLIGLVIFWGTRLVFQWFVYDAAHWRGNRTNTAVHLLFTLLWSYYTLVFAAALRLQF